MLASAGGLLLSGCSHEGTSDMRQAEYGYDRVTSGYARPSDVMEMGRIAKDAWNRVTGGGGAEKLELPTW